MAMQKAVRNRSVEASGYKITFQSELVALTKRITENQR